MEQSCSKGAEQEICGCRVITKAGLQEPLAVWLTHPTYTISGVRAQQDVKYYFNP